MMALFIDMLFPVQDELRNSNEGGDSYLVTWLFSIWRVERVGHWLEYMGLV